MHELSLSGAIVNTAVKHAEGRQVSVVSLRVGALRQVVPDTLDFYFGFVSKGTVCEGARLEQELIPAGLRCAKLRPEATRESPWRRSTTGRRCDIQKPCHSACRRRGRPRAP